MKYEANTVNDYISKLTDDRKEVIEKLREVILTNLPDGFEEGISYNMISYVVPLSRYPAGYHVKANEPLPFISIASQKNHIAIYHLGLYGDPGLEAWFSSEYAKQVPTKLDMGKSCIRFKNPTHIPYDLVAELCRKMTVDEYIKQYESATAKPKSKPQSNESTNVVDEYIASQDPNIQPILVQVRNAIRDALPEAQEKISWRMPTYWNKHNIFHFAAFKNHMGIYPGPAAIEYFSDRLTSYKSSKGAIQFQYKEPIPLDLIAEIAKWCYETGNHH